MGGAESKFEETDWIQANGRLQSSTETIDGRSPTNQYGVYYVTKTKMNQREFVVTDLEKNLLYVTKCVPGTLCWFDVYDGKQSILGGGGNNGSNDTEGLVLRVQVDLTRRSWIVYRMGIPTFPGQWADKIATDKLVNDRLVLLSAAAAAAAASMASSGKAKVVTNESSSAAAAAALSTTAGTSFLYRKCCITISWSRYTAVAMQYGPPPDENTMKLLDHHHHHDKQQKESTTRTTATSTSNSTSSSSNRIENAIKVTNGATSNNDNALEVSETNDNAEKEPTDSSDAKQSTTTTTTTTLQTAAAHQGMATWVKNQGRKLVWTAENNNNTTATTTTTTTTTTNQKYNKSDPREGVMDWDKPIVQCQEVFRKIVGHHQTMVLSKQRAQELLKQDQSQSQPQPQSQSHNNDFANDSNGFGGSGSGNGGSGGGGGGGDNVVFADHPQQETEEKGMVQLDDSAAATGQGEKIMNEVAERTEGNENNNNNHVVVQASHQNEMNHDVPKRRSREDHVKDEQYQSNNNNNNNDWNGGGHDGDGAEALEDDSSTISTKNDDENETKSPLRNDDDTDDSIIGYWKWENSWTTQQIKMHVAAGSDLALHVVLAVIVNQIRYERNAIAMSV